MEFGAGRKGDALVVAVRCQGKGRIEVNLRPTRVGFPLECEAGAASTTYNQVGVSGAHRSGTASVEAPAGVRWSMTVGRGEAARPQEEAGTGTEASG
ncbi:hypothetical protein JNUCC64_13460 [Streptomyces sp. JNUCC 64]